MITNCVQNCVNCVQKLCAARRLCKAACLLIHHNNKNTIIIDDYDEVYKTQPKNCVKAHPFEFNESGSEKDNFLAKLEKELKIMKKSIEKGNRYPAVSVNNKLKV